MRRGNHSKSRASKGLVLLLALVLVFGVAVGGTIAWLTAKSDTVTNTFTTSNITVTIAETKGTGDGLNKSYQMIPGHTIEKDPKVSVTADSEACYLFVKLTKSANFDTYLEYVIADGTDGWNALEGETGVYYREVEKGAGATGFDVLKGNIVTVKNSVTATDMANAKDANAPTLEVTAYACQLYQSAGSKLPVATAWSSIYSEHINPPANP